jgi:hypothetical protein
MMNGKGFGRKQSWPNFKILCLRSPGGNEEYHENFNQHRRSNGQDLNPGPPEYEAGVLMTWPRHSKLHGAVFLEKLTVAQTVKKFPRLIWNPNTHCVQKITSLVSIPSQINPVHIVIPYFFLISSSHLWVGLWLWKESIHDLFWGPVSVFASGIEEIDENFTILNQTSEPRIDPDTPTYKARMLTTRWQRWVENSAEICALAPCYQHWICKHEAHSVRIT